MLISKKELDEKNSRELIPLQRVQFSTDNGYSSKYNYKKTEPLD